MKSEGQSSFLGLTDFKLHIPITHSSSPGLHFPTSAVETAHLIFNLACALKPRR